jgi:hydrogenase maturation protease
VKAGANRAGNGHRPDERAGRRILIAGVGNVLRGDDGFGPAVIWALAAGGALPPAVHLLETGIGGIHLVLELLEGYDALILVDAVDRGRPPGSLFIVEPEVPDIATISAAEAHALATDTHQVVPGRALIMARAARALPASIRIVGCQPAETDIFSLELSPVVQASVPQAVAAIRSLLDELT